MKKVLITGGSGLVGSALTTFLQNKGISVCHLSRSKSKIGIETYIWNIEKQEIDTRCIANCDAIIHLAGANVGEGKWTLERKKEILDSRIMSTQLLTNMLKNNSHQVRTVICASAIGIYGMDESAILVNEESSLGNDFLANVTKEWENKCNEITELNIRKVNLRIGVVLALESGALPKMMQPIKYFVGAALGSGKQYLSWIHIHDLCDIIYQSLINDNFSGNYNAVAPHPVDNQKFTHILAKVLNRKVLLPNVPSFVLKILLGEMSNLVLLGKNVENKRLNEMNLTYKFPKLEAALQDLIK